MHYFILMFLISLSFSQTYKASKLRHQLNFDGIVEADWEAYNTISDFYQRWPNFAAKSQVKSEIYFAYDEENVYFAGRFYQDKHSIKGTRLRRDRMEMWSEDWVQINIDPFNEGASGFYLGLNPANAIIDGKLGPNGQEDESWDGIILTQTNIHDDHWSFEIQIPLSSIDFQNKKVQDWKITFGRSHSGLQEQSWAHQMNKDDQIRLTTYITFTDLQNLRIGKPYKVTPYIYGDILNDELNNKSEHKFKTGIELRYQPNPATKILATVNPDFAQLESDADVINVSDDPTQFNEKRPFFTTNSEFYNPAPAVRTRNIGEIDFGGKFIQDFGKLKYDVTYVRDGLDSDWFMGDFMYSDSKFIKLNLIGGLLNTTSSSYANTVLNTELSFLDRKLTAFTFLEYNNVIDHEFGTLSGINYRERNFNTGISIDIKPENYNSAVIGYFIQSNLVQASTYYNYTINFDENNAFLRQIHFGVDAARYSLHSNQDQAWISSRFSVNLNVLMSKTLGQWSFWSSIQPDTGQKFRNRNASGKYRDTNFFTTYQSFDLIESKEAEYEFGFQTDQSRMLSGNFEVEHGSIRQASGEIYNSSIKLKASESFQLEYSLQYLTLGSSPYQERGDETAHRVTAQYSLTDRFNIRGIYSLSDSDYPEKMEFDQADFPTGKQGFLSENPVLNITTSWEYEAGSFAYFVFNRARYAEGFTRKINQEKFNSFILKLNKSFQF
jgi:hypothetical protein